MTKEEILAGLEAMQKIQAANPPDSEKWQRAHAVMEKLVRLLTGKEMKDAAGRR